MPKLMKREALLSITKTREATVQASTTDDDDVLDFVIVSKDNDGMRYSWDMGGFYIEKLSIEGANLDRLNTFFKDHHRGVDSAIGHVSRKAVGDVVTASVTFDEDGASVKRKYLNKTLSDVSIGYEIKKYEVEERDKEPDIVTITEYEIFELSAVGIGFDRDAKHERGMDNIPAEQLREIGERLDRVASILK